MKKNIAVGIFTSLLFIGSATAYIIRSIKSDFKAEASKIEVPKVVNTSTTTPRSRQKEMIDGLPVVRISGSIIPINDLDDLIAKSDLIVIGKTDKSIKQAIPYLPRDSEGFIYGAVSEVSFKISKIFKGDKGLKEIRLGQQAALIEEKGQSYIRVFDEYMPMEPNQKYILFLSKGMPGTLGESLYFSTGVMFGKHSLENNKEEEAFPDPTFKEIRKAVKQRFKE
jgi:hypothetical protein